MYIIEKKKKTIITLKEKEIVEVQVMKGNPLKIQIKCVDGNIIVNELLSKQKNLPIGVNKKDCN